MIQTESHAVLSKDPVPPEAICGYRRKGKRDDWGDATTTWFENHPHYVQHHGSPTEPPRLVKIPNAASQNAAARSIAEAKAKQTAIDTALMPPPPPPPKAQLKRKAAPEATPLTLKAPPQHPPGEADPKRTKNWHPAGSKPKEGDETPVTVISEPKAPPPIRIRSGVSVKDEAGLRALGQELQTARPASKGTQLGPTPKTPSVVVDEEEETTQLAKKMRSLTTEDGLLISTPKGKLEEPPPILHGDSGQLVGDEDMNTTTSKSSSSVSAS